MVFTPKSMLRLKASASATSEFTSGHFNPVYPDITVEADGVRRVLLCSGKVYYDLLKHREETGQTDTAIVRVERLYPLPTNETFRAIAKYGHAELRWVQEEPANQGAWSFMGLALTEALGQPVRPISRPASSAPATGSHHAHEREQRNLVERAFSAS